MEKKLFPSLMCRDIGYPDCPHVTYGVIEETLFRNLKYHVINSHGYTDQSWEEELSKNLKILEN